MSLAIRLRNVFNTVLELDGKTTDADLRYQETPGWDSLGAVLLISAMEDEFHVQIGTNQALQIDTFDAAVKLLRGLGVQDQTPCP
ncbi:acyl carrier protein [Silvimonas terrae]|uniref:Acyl carrier protein n=1 Tax=Silvimonas terrae TaxID=300266 RepID=A0A840RC67_9NEIS|nr:acyl carrier protein [Silvimonas terrae]MBB5190945.1 acyl carrier protein [Silvimonas terrae]